MGAAKSIPVIGEVVTSLDVLVKVVIAEVIQPFAPQTAYTFEKAAQASVVDYMERSPIAASIISLDHAISGNNKAAREVWNKVGSSCLELVDGLPIVGHVKGAVHYGLGDKDKGDHCMKVASRSLVVGAVTIATTIATAGAGAVVITAAAVGSGLAMDGITTGCDSAIHQEYRPSGHIASVTQAIKSGDPVDFTDAALGLTFETGMTYIMAKGAQKLSQKQNATRVYRVMDSEAAAEAVTKQKLPRGHGASAGPRGETWISESVEHPKTYLPQKQASVPNGVQLEALEFKVDKGFYKNMKTNNCVKQSGSKASNQGGVIKNVMNNEKLASHPQGKVNVGIKNPNLSEFNNNVLRARRVDPSSWRFKNGMTKAVSRYGAETSATVGGGIGMEASHAEDDHYWALYNKQSM